MQGFIRVSGQFPGTCFTFRFRIATWGNVVRRDIEKCPARGCAVAEYFSRARGRRHGSRCHLKWSTGYFRDPAGIAKMPFKWFCHAFYRGPPMPFIEGHAMPFKCSATVVYDEHQVLGRRPHRRPRAARGGVEGEPWSREEMKMTLKQ